MELDTLNRIADLCLDARRQVDPVEARTLAVLLDMALLDVGRRIASHPDFPPAAASSPEPMAAEA